MHDELIIDQLIFGTSPRVREQLLLKADLTLTQAVDLAAQVESSIQTERTLTGKEGDGIKKVAASTGRRSASTKTKSTRPQRHAEHRCSHCGRVGHASGADPDCPARGQECKTCGKRNHFAIVCKSSTQAQRGRPKIREVEVETLAVYSIRQTEGLYKTATVLLNGKPARLLIDTAAKVSLLNSTTFQQIFGDESELRPATRRLRSYNGTPIEASGEMRAKVEYDGSTVEDFTFTVVPEGDNLMGIDLVDKLKIQVRGPSGQLIASVSSRQPAAMPAWIPAELHDVSEGLGEIVGFSHRPRMHPGVPPVAQRPRRVPLALQQECVDQVNRWQEQGIVERVPRSYQPEWQSNTTCARKADGSLRLCIDLRAVNKAVIPDQMVLPTFNDLVTIFSGSKVFTRIDLNQSYLQLPLHPDARDLTCFHTESGLFRFRRMPFGLSSAPAAFQKVIGHMLRGVSGTVHYIDDIVVHAATEAEHDKRVVEVLRRLRHHRVTVNGRKCSFRQRENRFCRPPNQRVRHSPSAVTRGGCVEAEDSDELEGSRLISRLRKILPELREGPLACGGAVDGPAEEVGQLDVDEGLPGGFPVHQGAHCRGALSQAFRRQACDRRLL
jgi:hypothetical protein